jgi:DNA (cytosine-5)-methyltransferase 1
MMENVPALAEYRLFKEVLYELDQMGYNPKCHIVNVANYGVAQRRKRFIMVGSLIGNLDIAEGNNHVVTVRDIISGLESVNVTTDALHKIYPKHIPRIEKMISLIPKDGGSRKCLPSEYLLECHKKPGVGFSDVYGRLRWDNVSSTITGGCLNPSKGRFLHPEENRCITAREAALLQSFPRYYIFPIDIPKTQLALLIGNALPPEFSRIQGVNIYKHLERYCK